MPCPRCRRIIDARLRHCPHCGVDTDAMLRTPRALVPFVLIGLLVLAGAVDRFRPVIMAALAGLVTALVVARLRRR